MAEAPQEILVLWTVLDERKLRIPAEIWKRVDSHVVAVAERIIGIVGKSGGGDIPVEDANAIIEAAYSARSFLLTIKKSSDGTCGVTGDGIVLDHAVADMMAHYIGNDLYKTVLIADVSGPNPEPLPAEYGHKIVANVTAIKDFVQKLREKTGGSA